MQAFNSMIKHERALYSNGLGFLLNFILFPLKMIIPQPIIAKIPGLTSNLTIRTRLVLNEAKGKLLDIGCGNNLLVKQYREKGGEGTGVDVYPWEGVDKVVEDSSNLSLEDNSFDSVSFVACINHIPYREKSLLEAKRVLKKDGRLIPIVLINCIIRSIGLWA